MADVTLILEAIQRGDVRATDELLPVVYDELRKLAAQRLSSEKPGQTITASDLVHDTYIRLLGGQDPTWENRRHFFGAAAEAMRRILIERARHKQSARAGGEWQRVDFDHLEVTPGPPLIDVLAIDEALRELECDDPHKAEIVKLRFYAGLSVKQVAAALDVSERTILRQWRFVRIWLLHRLTDGQQ